MLINFLILRCNTIFTAMTLMFPPALVFLLSLHLSEFPSGSSINLYGNKFFVVGDDATHVLVLDKIYTRKGSITLFPGKNKRIAKHEKRDLEASTIIRVGNDDILLLVGSGATKEREMILTFCLSGNRQIKPAHYQMDTFLTKIRGLGVNEINVEGATVVNDFILLASRGNLTNTKNHVIITRKDFWLNQSAASPRVVELRTKNGREGFIGVSELHYLQQKDILLMTFTTENVDNAINDGEIGASYLGIIEGVSSKLNDSHLIVDHLIDLSSTNEIFKHQKVEGICAEVLSENDFLLHLVSDNDKGETTLFRLKLSF